MNNFNFSFTVLYIVCRLAWANCLNNIAVFTSRKPFYDAAYVAARVAEIDAAEQLPDDQARGEAAETLRIHLVDKGKVCIEYWNLLDRYIASAFPKNEWKPKREAAGSDLYAEAVHENWDKLRTMMSNGFEFISNNTVALSAGMNMPAGFPAEFEGVKNAFNADHDAFLLAEETAHTGTQTKGEAHDAIYEKMRLMLDDGKAFFVNNAALKDQFILTNLVELVGTPTGGGGGELAEGTLNSGETKNIFSGTQLSATSKFRTKVAPGQGYWLFSANNATDGFNGSGFYVQGAPPAELDWNQIGGPKAFVNVYNPNGMIVDYQVEVI